MSDPATPSRAAHRTYAVTVLAGLAGAGLTALAGSRVWATTRGDAAGIKIQASVTGAEAQPLVASLGLVAMAAWGVLLVIRGRARRLVALVGLLASLGALSGVMLGFGATQDAATEAAIAKGAIGDALVASLSAWFYLAGLGAVVASAAFGVAVARSPRWPAMGSKYDAPASRLPAQDEDMWRALDEGRDPTS
jgi:hypothetical protein